MDKVRVQFLDSVDSSVLGALQLPLTLHFEVGTAIDTERLGSCIELSSQNVLDDMDLIRIARIVKQATGSDFDLVRGSGIILNSKQIDN